MSEASIDWFARTKIQVPDRPSRLNKRVGFSANSYLAVVLLCDSGYALDNRQKLKRLLEQDNNESVRVVWRQLHRQLWEVQLDLTQQFGKNRSQLSPIEGKIAAEILQSKPHQWLSTFQPRIYASAVYPSMSDAINIAHRLVYWVEKNKRST